MQTAEVVFVIYVLIFLMAHGNAHLWPNERKGKNRVDDDDEEEDEMMMMMKKDA